MINLMKLELKRNNVRSYIIASMIICVVLIGFVYLFAYAPHIDPDPDLQIFAGYYNIITLLSMISMAAFATLASIIYTRFIIDDYKEKYVILLFSYPIHKGKLLFSKLLVVFLFTTITMVICNILVFSVFGISESIVPLVDEMISMNTMLQALKVTITMSIIAANIGIIAVGIGFIKKSIPSTIISAILLSSLFCNIMFNVGSEKNDIVLLFFTCITIFLGGIVTIMLMKKVNNMEAE